MVADVETALVKDLGGALRQIFVIEVPARLDVDEADELSAPARVLAKLASMPAGPR